MTLGMSRDKSRQNIFLQLKQLIDYFRQQVALYISQKATLAYSIAHANTTVLQLEDQLRKLRIEEENLTCKLSQLPHTMLSTSECADLLRQLSLVKRIYLKSRWQHNICLVSKSIEPEDVVTAEYPYQVVMNLLKRRVMLHKRDCSLYRYVMLRAVYTVETYFRDRTANAHPRHPEVRRLYEILRHWKEQMTDEACHTWDASVSDELITIIQGRTQLSAHVAPGYLNKAQSSKLIKFISIFANPPADSDRYTGSSLEAGLNDCVFECQSYKSWWMGATRSGSDGFKKHWEDAQRYAESVLSMTVQEQVILTQHLARLDVLQTHIALQTVSAEDRDFLYEQIDELVTDIYIQETDTQALATLKQLLFDGDGLSLLNDEQRAHLGKFELLVQRHQSTLHHTTFAYEMATFECGSHSPQSLTSLTAGVYKRFVTSLENERIEKKMERQAILAKIDAKNEFVTLTRGEFEKFECSLVALLETLKKQVRVAQQLYTEAQQQTGVLNRWLFYSEHSERDIFTTVLESDNYTNACRMLRKFFESHSACRDASATTALMTVFFNTQFGLFVASEQGFDMTTHIKRLSCERLHSGLVSMRSSALFWHPDRFLGLHLNGSKLRKQGHHEMIETLKRCAI